MLISGHFSLTDSKSYHCNKKSETLKKHESSVSMEVEEESKKLQRFSPDTEMSKNWNNNPSSRIIRVSKGSGGKDRHSKVLTSKGLRDRRIRLSVTTAIQFYDLQDRLGFDQPSKAIEWLIKAASDSISDLPPLSFNDQTQQNQTKSGCSSGTSESSLLSLSRTEKAKEHKDKDPSFTQLLTGGFNNRNHNWTGSDCYNPVQDSSLNQFSFVVPPEYNFGTSSSDSPGAAVNGGYSSSRGTLQSNSQSLFGNNNNNNNVNQRSSSPMDSQSISIFMANPPVLDHQIPASFDGRLYLYHRSSDDKRKA